MEFGGSCVSFECGGGCVLGLVEVVLSLVEVVSFEFGGGCVSFEFGGGCVLSLVEVVFWVWWKLCFEFGGRSDFGG